MQCMCLKKYSVVFAFNYLCLDMCILVHFGFAKAKLTLLRSTFPTVLQAGAWKVLSLSQAIRI